MPPQNQQNQSRPRNKDGRVVTLATQEHFSGPLPHPTILEGYEKVMPGAAERIIKRFESQSEHRQRLESFVIKTDSVKSFVGLVLGFIIAMTAIVGGIYCALKGHPFLGDTLSFAGLAILVGAFITNRFTGNQDSKE